MDQNTKTDLKDIFELVSESLVDHHPVPYKFTGFDFIAREIDPAFDPVPTFNDRLALSVVLARKHQT